LLIFFCKILPSFKTKRLISKVLPDDPDLDATLAAFVAEGVQSVRPEDRLGVHAVLSNYGRIR